MPTVAVAVHDGFYGVGTGAGHANRDFLQILIRLLAPQVRLVVLPVYLSTASPGYQANWHRESLGICQAADVMIRPVDNGTSGQARFGDVTAFQHLATSTARVLLNEVLPGARPGAVIFSDIPFLGVPPLLPPEMLPRLAVVPRSTGLLHDPANRARIQFESDGLRYLASHGGWVATISGYMRDHLARNYRVPTTALLDLPEGLDDPQQARYQPQLPSGAERGFLLTLGRAQPYKGWDDLLDALAALREQRVPLPHALLAAVADQPRLTAYQRHLASRVQDLDLDATLLTRFDPAYRTWLSHPALQAVVVPSRAEPSSRIPLEAYAAGAAPVVVTTVGSLAEQVLDGVTGFTAPPANPASLASAIGRALSLHDSERDRMRAAASRLACNRFDHPGAVLRFLAEFAPWATSEPVRIGR
jgi:glycosyltransferase involved in cell wall biosynthesis